MEYLKLTVTRCGRGRETENLFGVALFRGEPSLVMDLAALHQLHYQDTR